MSDIQSTIKRAKGNPEALDMSMSLAHLTDTEAYDISHILTHAKTRVTTLAHAKRQLEHIKDHGEDAARANKKLIEKLKKIPSVREEFNDLKTERTEAS